MATEKDKPEEQTATYIVKGQMKKGGKVYGDGEEIELTEAQAAEAAGYDAIVVEEDEEEEVEEHDEATGERRVVRKKKAAKRARR